MDMVYVDIMSDTEIRFGDRRYIRYLTAFANFTELGGMTLDPSSFSNIHNSLASTFETLYAFRWDYYWLVDKEIIDEMRKMVRIVSAYRDTVDYEYSFITFLIYNYTKKSSIFDVFDD